MTVTLKIEHDGGPYRVEVMPVSPTDGLPLQSSPAAVLENKGESTTQSIYVGKSLLITEAGIVEEKAKPEIAPEGEDATLDKEPEKS